MKNTDPLLIDTGRGFSVFYNNRHLYSHAEPEERAILRSNQTPIQSDTLYIISSPLLFYGVKEILERIPSDSHLICFEYSDPLHELSKKNLPDYISNSNRCSFIKSTDPWDIFSIVDKLGIWNFRRVRAINLTGGYSLNASVYRNILNNIDIHIQEYWKNRMTLIHMGPLWIKNIFLNLYKIHMDNNLCICKHPSTEYPILVTGAGESIESSIKFIKEKRNFIKILAVDTSVSVLVENGIQPDYIIAVDAQIYNFYDFMEVKNSKIPLFFDITGYTGIPSVMKGSLYPFVSNFADTKLLKRLDDHNLLPVKLPALGSVGLTAIYLALKITKNKVFYTGLDFAYKIGKSHANGSPRNLAELTVTDRLNPMEQPGIYYARPLIHNKDKNGTDCTTDLILASYAELMNNNFKETERLFDIGSIGLSSGGKVTKTANIILNKQNNKDIFTEELNTTIKINNFLEFVTKELALISDLYESVYKYLSGESNEKKVILFLLEEVDYIYLHFPDKSPEPNLDPGFLKRILVSCGYYMNIIKQYI